MNRSSVLALVTDGFGGGGGIAQYNRDLLRALALRDGDAPITVVPRHGDAGTGEVPPGIEQISAKRSRLAYGAAALITGLSRPVDVVFCGHVHIAPLALAVARLCRAKLVIQAHGIEIWERHRGLQRHAVEAADLILCVSRYTRARVLQWAAIEPERVVVIPDTVADYFTPGDFARSRKALGLSGKRVLLTVGRMSSRERYKGQDRVIAAIPKLTAAGHDILYLVVGGGDDRPRLEAFAQQHGVQDRVRFLGPISIESLVEIYRAADLFVMPSTGEGFGIAYIEAMASGTPALGLAAAGASDALADGDLGTIVAEPHLTEAIDRLLSVARPEARELSMAVRSRFGYDHFRRQTHAAFNRLQCGGVRTDARRSERNQ